MKRLAEWVESRTGFGGVTRRLFLEEVAASAGWAQVFGSIALFLLVVQAVTGMLLALNYAASAGDAYDSITYIMHSVADGRIIRGLHHWGASMMVIVVCLHAGQVFLYGAYKKPREVTWIVGVLLLLFTLGFGLTGYLLPWDNRAYWGTIITTQIAGQIPWLGSYVQRAIGADHGVGVVTFSRFYGLHVLVFPAATVFFVAVHLALVRKHGLAPAVSNAGRKKTFFPEQVFRDTVGIFIAFALLFCAALAIDAPLERMADPTDSAYVPRPEWYFLFLFQSLKLFHGWLESVASVGLPSVAVLALVLVPFLDRTQVRGFWDRRWAISIVILAVGTWASLTYAAMIGTPQAVASRAVPVQHQRVLLLIPDELAGFEYFRREDCRTCHNLTDGEPKVGPNLAVIETRRSPDWMESHFRDPGGESAPRTRPTLSAAQMNALVSFMSKLTPEKAVDLEEAPAPLLEGADVFVSNLCASCHKVNGQGGSTGPSLNGVAARRSRQWIEKHFHAPQVMSPGSIMPPYHFAPNEQDQLISYLSQLQ